LTVHFFGKKIKCEKEIPPPPKTEDDDDSTD